MELLIHRSPFARRLEKMNRRVIAGYRQVFGLAGCVNSYLPPASQLAWSKPARLVCGFRSCLPLRDSPGVTPGSLIDNECSLAHSWQRLVGGQRMKSAAGVVGNNSDHPVCSSFGTGPFSWLSQPSPPLEEGSNSILKFHPLC